MSTSLLPDPLQLWRDALTRLEGEVNTLATGSLQSQEMLRALHQFSGASLGLQQLFEKAVAGYLRRANLPSRKDVADLAESLRRIEDKLDRLLPPEAVPAVRRPPRTRRPPGVAAAPAPEPEPTSAVAKKKPHRRAAPR
jgi:hypothetical protein